MCVLLAASGSAGRPLWQRHRATAEEALAAAWPGERAGRYPVALLVWMMRSAGQAQAEERQSAFELVSAQCDCPEPWARAVARYVSGFGFLGAGDTPGAEHAFGLAVDEFGVLGDRWGAALALDMLAGVASGRGDRVEAVALTDRAIALTEQLGALEDAADLLVNRGDQFAADDRPAAGADYARAAGAGRRRRQRRRPRGRPAGAGRPRPVRRRPDRGGTALLRGAGTDRPALDQGPRQPGARARGARPHRRTAR